jgi:uncharacterized protein
MSAVHLSLSQSLAFDRALTDATGLGSRAVAFDRQTLRHYDVDGRMHVERCNITKANVCPYFGREIPSYQALGLDPNRIYMLYRDPAELERGAHTFRNLQLLMLHKVVSANEPQTEITVGTIGSDVEYHAPYLTASIAVWTGEGIKLIESEQQAELSCSYRYRADMTPGVTSEGVAYDGVMRDIMGNHVALVERGRAGPDVVVSDSLPLELPKMFKRPNLLALVVAAQLKQKPTEEQRLALDAALAANTAADCEANDEDMEDDPDKPGEKRKKVAKDGAVTPTGSPASPGPKEGEKGKALDAAAMDAAITARGYITKADAEKLASDAASEAVSRVNALHKARADVEPLVGIVAMDSAAAVYEFALKKENVALDGVPPAAYGALVEQVKARKRATGAAPAGVPKVAADAAIAASSAMGLGRIAQA